MSTINIPVGRSGFADIRSNGYYYIDKSGLIIELLKTNATQVTLITRPRRFGKTLGMSMLSEFFDIRKESAPLFEGLEVSENKPLCKLWMNQWPVLFLTFKDVDGLDFESAYGMLEMAIADLCKEHAYLADSSLVNENDRKSFVRLSACEARKNELQNAISVIMRMMEAHYGKKLILLLDEYDVPVAKASTRNTSNKGYYDKMLEVIRPLLSTAIKDNNSLKFAVITGCLKIAKESIFTGTNNFVSDTISDTRLNEYFGFTQTEVDVLLWETGLVAYSDRMKEWYDGYRFGNICIYCPWDVMNYVKDLALNQSTKPVGYWKNSSDNAVIRSFIDYSGESITKKFETLLSGGYIIQKITEDLDYNCIYSSEENLWTILYLTGYLTIAKCIETDRNAVLQDGTYALIIPNAEIREIFEETIKKWFEDSSPKWQRQALFAAVWNGDAETATKEMTKLLRKTISYHDYKEDFYHAFLAGIFAGAGYIVESNKEHGEGRSDVIVADYLGAKVVVFEAKYSHSLKDLSKDCDKAVKQINTKMYAKEFEEDYEQVICYGISFYKKRCMVRIKED